MGLYYYAAVRPTGSTDPWVDRWVQAHQLLVDWDEAQATKVKRLTSTNWNADWGDIAGGTDADSTMESTVLFQEGETGNWKSWNLTNVTQEWVDGSATNYGVILWATNEDTDGYEMRFRSSEYASNQPKLEVTYTEDPLKTVFFLKDHLGSIRATVEEDGDVVGYTDYDPWGYLLANRVLETGWSGQNVAQNKFTGKEWDDDFGVDLYHFDWRRYDPEIGRWVNVDPMDVLYPGLSPFSYVANNPLLLTDLTGAVIDTSKLSEEHRKLFRNSLEQLLESEFFKEVWQTLSESDAVYEIAINSEQGTAALYDPKSSQTGSGGVLSFKNEEAFQAFMFVAHESYHAFQHDQKWPGRVVGVEIEANLFANAVSSELFEKSIGSGMMFMGGGNPTFDYAFKKLQLSQKFDLEAWYLANTRFHVTSFGRDVRYRGYGVRFYYPLISRFYPLTKF